MTFEEVGGILDEIADEIPQEFYKNLNGGILLLPEAHQNPGDAEHNLYVLGEYVRNQMGRYIIIYYGSFAALFEHDPPERIRKELKETLLHEFTHHVESLAGVHDLEIKDEVKMARLRAPQRYRIRR